MNIINKISDLKHLLWSYWQHDQSAQYLCNQGIQFEIVEPES